MISLDKSFAISPITPNIIIKLLFAIQIISINVVYYDHLRQYSRFFFYEIYFIKNSFINLVDGKQIRLSYFRLVISLWKIYLTWLIKKHNQWHR